MAIVCCLFLFGGSAFSQSDSCRIRISLLTCSPGEDLYSIFGHTGLRVTDSTAGSDVVFNYGTFDDSDPYFYLKFTKGIMLYSLSVEDLSQFMYEYQMERRGVTEQVLNLSCQEKEKLVRALWLNARPENRTYEYGFHTDNCTTRARDIVARNTSSPVSFKNILQPDRPSFRQLIHSYLNKAEQRWSKFGIDLLLGSYLDAKVSNEQSMFLPDYLMKGFDSASVNAHSLVAQKKQLLAQSAAPAGREWLTPFVVFTMLFIIVAGISLAAGDRWRRALHVFDRIFFLLLGIMGLVIITLWTIRVDTVCRNNYNLLWALPSHLFIAFALQRKAKWVRVYFRITFFLALLIVLCWWLIPQQLNWAVAPILGLILVRSYQQSK